MKLLAIVLAVACITDMIISIRDVWIAHRYAKAKEDTIDSRTLLSFIVTLAFDLPALLFFVTFIVSY